MLRLRRTAHGASKGVREMVGQPVSVPIFAGKRRKLGHPGLSRGGVWFWYDEHRAWRDSSDGVRGRAERKAS